MSSLKQKGAEKLKKLALQCFLGLVFVFLVFGSISYGLNALECSNKWANSSIESRYVMRGGCQVKVDGNWIPSDNFRIN